MASAAVKAHFLDDQDWAGICHVLIIPLGNLVRRVFEMAGFVTRNVNEAAGNTPRNVLEAAGNAIRTVEETGGNVVHPKTEQLGDLDVGQDCS